MNSYEPTTRDFWQSHNDHWHYIGILRKGRISDDPIIDNKDHDDWISNGLSKECNPEKCYEFSETALENFKKEKEKRTSELEGSKTL